MATFDSLLLKDLHIAIMRVTQGLVWTFEQGWVTQKLQFSEQQGDNK
jgi:hypothetical protein